MISSITIKNFKSVVDVTMPIGRFNLMIGANGCGKSNILEGIALGAAASSDKLEYEYFANRGIRVVEPRFMLPAFDDIEAKDVFIELVDDEYKKSSFRVFYNNDAKPARWQTDSMDIKSIIDYLNEKIISLNEKGNKQDYLESIINHSDLVDIQSRFFGTREEIDALENAMTKVEKEDQKKMRVKAPKWEFAMMTINPAIKQFIIYSLEESKLRKSDDSNRIYPLGRHGEGLFAYLKQLAQRPDALEIFEEIKENLKVLDWFDDLKIPEAQLSNEFNLQLKDCYLAETINLFDQRSTNEGFLYLLFYLTLVISDETPRFFAIENIDTAFNPKLCREVTRRLIELARKHDKQIIATTHNAAVLDGLNLNDDDVRLHVVRRTIDGYTKTNRITLNEDMTISLSEAWQKGLIGGLPDNF